jgi:polar amino acid transport system substrate-binding protein
VLASLKPKLVEEMEASDALRIIDPPFTAIRQAVGIAKNKPEALRFINEVISELSQNGDIAASLEKHGVNKKLSLPS